MKCFSSSSNLKQHYNVHKDIVKRHKYFCFIKNCSKSYLYICTLKKHIIMMHKSNYDTVKKSYVGKNFFDIYQDIKNSVENNIRNDRKFDFLEFKTPDRHLSSNEIETGEEDTKSKIDNNSSNEEITSQTPKIFENKVLNFNLICQNNNINNVLNINVQTDYLKNNLNQNYLYSNLLGIKTSNNNQNYQIEKLKRLITQMRVYSNPCTAMNFDINYLDNLSNFPNGNLLSKNHQSNFLNNLNYVNPSSWNLRPNYFDFNCYNIGYNISPFLSFNNSRNDLIYKAENLSNFYNLNLNNNSYI